MSGLASGRTLSQLLGQRYRTEPFAVEAELNNTLEAILGHKTTRSYLPRRLPPGMIELLIGAAQSAPTSSNLQLWSVVSVEDPDRKSRLARLAHSNPHIEEAPLLLMFVADLARARTIFADRNTESEGLDYADTLLVASLDAAFAAQNVVIAASSLGLGTCYIGAMRNSADLVAEELGLPSEAFVVFGLTIGYPDAERASDVKPRLPQSLVWHKERYDAQALDADLGHYNDRLKSFQAEQKMPSLDWSDIVVNRLGSKTSLKGRVRLVDILRRHRGFKML